MKFLDMFLQREVLDCVAENVAQFVQIAMSTCIEEHIHVTSHKFEISSLSCISRFPPVLTAGLVVDDVHGQCFDDRRNGRDVIDGQSLRRPPLASIANIFR